MVLVTALASLTLAGCGRRGSLDRPRSAPAVVSDPATAEQAEPDAPRKRDTPFILDAII
nr:lipoprotein [Hongsoonwoonella zoysiae]